MPERLRTVLIFGPPGAGKGTQGKLLGQIPGIFHHSSGDVFRNLDKSTPAGRTFAEYSGRGELVPDDITTKVWRENIDRRSAAGDYLPDRDLLILDGIPRTANQAVLMEEQIEVLRIIHLVCTDEEAFFERLRKRARKENRADDTEEVIRRRYEVYEAETRPVLEHYPSGLIGDVDAQGSHARVLRDALGVVVPVLERSFAAAEG